MPTIPGWIPVQRLAIVLALAVAALAVWWLDRPRGRWSAALRRRFVLGLPWGTITTALGVLAVYLFAQGGLDHWFAPLVLPFRAWSYFYPLGMVTASFAHVGPGHLIGNLVGTLAYGAVAEFAFGHFPRRRGATAFGSLRTNPYVRAFVAVPGAAAAAGLLSSAFAIGPVIGFSSVVFAFAGVALVNYPIATVAAVTAGSALRLAQNALRNPLTIAESHPTYSSPWWADIAIQGHALGLLLGVVGGAWVVRQRGDDRPSALRVWTGTLLFAVAQSLWAVYWFRGNGRYVLFRAIGLALVVALATVVALAVASSDRPLVPSFGPAPGSGSASRWRTAAAEVLRAPRWRAAAAVLLVAAAAISGPAVLYNLTVVGEEELPGESVEVGDYQVTYAEDVPNGLISAFEFRLFGETTAVNTSGVIVRNPDRSIWTTAVSKGRLAFAGQSRVRVGGVGWRESVVAVRRGWTAAGGNTTYRVSLRHDGRRTVAYTAPPARARPVVGGRNISVATTPEEFLLVVRRGNETDAAPIPENNGSVTLANVTFVRERAHVTAVYRDTRVRIARKETYRGQR